MPSRVMWVSISSWRLAMSMRFIATVTIWVPEASIASDMSWLLRNLPVPTNRREEKVLLAI